MSTHNAPPPDLGGFHIVASIRQRTLDRQFTLLHRRLPDRFKQIEEGDGRYGIKARLLPHRVRLEADPGQKNQRAYVRVHFRVESLRAQDRKYESCREPWVLAYRTQLHKDTLSDEDWNPESLHLSGAVKEHVAELKEWEELRIYKIYMRFTGARMRDHFVRDHSELPDGMSDNDLDVLLDLMDSYFKSKKLMERQNIFFLSPAVPPDYKYDDAKHMFWGSSLHFSITHNTERPEDSSLNFMAMALHQPPPPEEALRDDDDPHGKIFHLPKYEGSARDMGGVLRFSQELTIIHGFIDSLNYMARLRSGQHQRNWAYHPAPEGRWGSPFTTVVRGGFRHGGEYEFRTMHSYNFVVDNHRHPEHGECVRFRIGGWIRRIASVGRRSASTEMEARLVLYLTIDDGRNFYFHEDHEHSRARHPRPQIVDESAYRIFRQHTDGLICDDGSEFYEKSGPYLNMPDSERNIFNPEHWRNQATPVFLPDGDFVNLRDPSLMYFRGYNNLRAHIAYVGLTASTDDNLDLEKDHEHD